MYQLISAIAKPISGGGRWTDVAIGDTPLNTLFTLYSKVLVTLFNPFVTGNVCLDLDTIRPRYGGRSITFSAFLVEIGDDSLDTTSECKKLNTRYARYADLRPANYKVEPIHPSAAPDSQHPMADKTWLYITRPNTDYDLFHKSVLVSVNGFYHMTSFNSQGVYVVDGAASGRLARDNNVGGLSFREIGALRFIPITPDMVKRQSPNIPLKDAAIIDLNEDIGKKTMMIVIGGYLHLHDDTTAFMSSDQLVCVKFNNFPLLDRYYESVDKIDLSSLNLEKAPMNPKQISVPELYGDDALRAYLSLSQSFVVLVDNNDVFANKIQIHASRLPGNYISHVAPMYPMINNTGLAANYTYRFEQGIWAIGVSDSTFMPRMFNTTDGRNEPSVDPCRMSEERAVNTSAYFLQIGTDL